MLIMSCVPARITSTREQEYFVHQRSSAIKEITQNDPRKGSLRALETESKKNTPKIPYQLKPATLRLQKITRRYQFLTLPPLSPECLTEKGKIESYQKPISRHKQQFQKKRSSSPTSTPFLPHVDNHACIL
jgi:hypothetical protein